jgi:copper homeostasis protein CutC
VSRSSIALAGLVRPRHGDVIYVYEFIKIEFCLLTRQSKLYGSATLVSGVIDTADHKKIAPNLREYEVILCSTYFEVTA